MTPFNTLLDAHLFYSTLCQLALFFVAKGTSYYITVTAQYAVPALKHCTANFTGLVASVAALFTNVKQPTCANSLLVYSVCYVVIAWLQLAHADL